MNNINIFLRLSYCIQYCTHQLIFLLQVKKCKIVPYCTEAVVQYKERWKPKFNSFRTNLNMSIMYVLPGASYGWLQLPYHSQEIYAFYFKAFRQLFTHFNDNTNLEFDIGTVQTVLNITFDGSFTNNTSNRISIT